MTSDIAAEILEALPVPCLWLRTVWETDGTPDLRVDGANAAARFRFGDGMTGRWLRRDEPVGPVNELVDLMTSGTADGTIERRALRNARIQHDRFRPVSVGIHSAVLIEDITGEVRMREDLTASADALARTQRRGNVGVWELDIVSGDVYWSTQIHKLLGLDEAGLDGFRSVVHPEDVPLVDHLQARLLAQPGPYRATHRIVRHGEVRTVDQFVQSVAGDDDRPTRLIGTMVDVTAMHQLRDELLQAERVRTIGVVAAGVAHDFNNLLTVVEGHASLLHSQTDDPDMRDGLDAIRRAATQASVTTRKLMGLGRQEAIDSGPVEIEVLFADVAGWARPAAPQIALIEQVDSDGLVAEADAGVLRQVLLDLVLNACDARATAVRLCADSVVRDEASPAVASGSLRAGHYVRIEVIDDGTGMDPATRDRALEPFFSTKSQRGGSGLGLATALANITRMGGHLDIDTEVGRGTTVSILVPAADAVPREIDARDRPRATRVVVATADATLADHLAGMVADEGHQVVVAPDVQALAFCLASEPIDGAVIDRGLADDHAWPDEIASCPTVWVNDVSGADDNRAVRDRIAGLMRPR